MTDELIKCLGSLYILISKIKFIACPMVKTSDALRERGFYAPMIPPDLFSPTENTLIHHHLPNLCRKAIDYCSCKCISSSMMTSNLKVLCVGVKLDFLVSPILEVEACLKGKRTAFQF